MPFVARARTPRNTGVGLGYDASVPRHLRHAVALGALVLAACARPAATRPTPREPPASAPLPPLVPAPTKMTACAAPPMKVTASTRVQGPRDVASQLERWLGLPPSVVSEPGAIELRLLAPDTSEPALDVPSIEAQSFTLEVDGHRAVVSSKGRAGLFYGAQALAQLAGARAIGRATPPLGNGEWSLPCVSVEDRPRSAFRAMHLDVARHFFDRATVERYVDLIAFYRFNVFHWHLVDDQGFRITLTRHPELASPDAAYSQRELTDVIATARERFVTVIPEIEMPGHARAILAAHPELSCTGEPRTTPRSWGVFEDVLCAGNPGSLELVKDVLTEVARIFPSHLVHVGGDEVPATRWNACPKCRAVMEAAHTDAPGLEHLFMQHVFMHLATLHRRPLVWDEALPDAPGVNPPIIVAWQSKERGDLAVARGFDTVYAPYESVYFNFSQSGLRGIEPGHDGHVSLETVRAFDPGTGPHVLGGEGALWTEYVWHPEDIDTLAMPRAAALADALWSGKRDDFTWRFGAAAHLAMLDRSGVRYFIEPPRGVRARRVVVDETFVTFEVPPLFRQGVIRYTRDGEAPTSASPRYRDPLQVTGTTTITAALFLPNGRASAPVRTTIVKEAPRPARPARAPGLSCTYWEGHFHRLSQIGGRERATVTVDTLDITEIQRAAGSSAPEHFAFRCRGAVEIGETGVHRFFVKSDDGARLLVDGEPVAEIDGEFGPREEDGEIALERGLHELDVLYFQAAEGKELRLDVEGPHGGRAPLRYHRR